MTFLFGGAYDRVANIGKVAADHGLSIETEILPSPKDAFAALRDSADVAGGEMSASFFMTQYSKDPAGCELVALPVWVSRAFRHSNIYVRDGSDITNPSELRGKRIGLPEYGMTMAVWLRGIFADDYGLLPRDVQWVSHRTPTGLDPETLIYPADVDITSAPEGVSLPEQLRDGSIDAWIGAGSAPRPAGVRRLFLNATEQERDFYFRTNIFPVMHVLVMKRQLVESEPGLAQKVFTIFNESKIAAQNKLWSTSVSYPTLPWTLAAVEDQAALMGTDYWPYGVERNRPTLEALVRYMNSQHLTWRHLPLEDYFMGIEPPS
ncbi:4,5-dihydroxyphthalate decarboxylase [Williamsia muralis]|uniref:4,5-dihydroxyphthalate decarboxylase n=1 Tax=Williamsia marianensis TaxID=85044 RepID=A0A2G3PK74_WILMA|nr:4,5-dihydroxyphthalate decarboxylase [Williamsia marianensis]